MPTKASLYIARDAQRLARLTQRVPDSRWRPDL